MTPAVGELLGEAWVQFEATHIGRRQLMVAQWLTLRPTFVFCKREQGYRGEGGVVIRGYGRNSQVNLGVDPAVGADKPEQE